MKIPGMILCIVFGLIFLAIGVYSWISLADFHGLLIVVRILPVAASWFIAFLCLRGARYFFQSFCLDMHLSQMRDDYRNAPVGEVVLDCPSEEAYKEFWRLYKTDKMYDRKNYDAEKKKMIFKKR